MELVELSTVSLAEAMFEKLGLPKPVYHVRPLKHGGYKSQIEFHRTRERYLASACRTKLSSPTCVDGETSMNRAADLAIEYMETREKKVLVDYSYHQLQQQKQAYARVSERMLEKTQEINCRNQTIKQITREASNYLEQVHAASNKIHDLTGVALDPATSMSFPDLKQAILEISAEIVALQNTTATSRLSLEEKGMYSDDNVTEPVYNGASDEETDEDYHQDMDDDYGHYVRSP